MVVESSPPIGPSIRGGQVSLGDKKTKASIPLGNLGTSRKVCTKVRELILVVKLTNMESAFVHLSVEKSFVAAIPRDSYGASF